MVIVLTSVHQNLCDPRVFTLLIVVSDRPAYRRCLDELGTGTNDSDYFHVETILKLVMVVVAARLGSANRETWRVNQGIS